MYQSQSRKCLFRSYVLPYCHLSKNSCQKQLFAGFSSIACHALGKLSNWLMNVHPRPKLQGAHLVEQFDLKLDFFQGSG